MRRYIVNVRSRIIVRGRVGVEASSPGAAMNKAQKIADENEEALINRDEASGRFEAFGVEVVKNSRAYPARA